MKIKRNSGSTSTKRLIPMSEAAENMTKKILDSAEEELLVLLEPMSRLDASEWPFGRSDLHHWADVLDRFDEMYEQIIEGLWNKETGCQQLAFTKEGERLVVAMLGFTRGLLEYCSSRNLFNSYEHCKSFLASSSTPVLEATLELLVLPARKLEAQQSLRKTFQERIGVDELAVLGQLTHPPFIEFQGVKSRRVDLTAFRSIKREDSELVRLLAISIYLLFMATLDVELDSSLFSAQPTAIGDAARSLALPPVGTGDLLRRQTAIVTLLRAALKVPSRGSEVVYALSLAAGHGPIAEIARQLAEALKERRDPGLHHFFISSFLDLLTSLALSFEADISLTQSGIVEELIGAGGDCDPRQYKLMERVLTIVDILLHRMTEALDAFFAADGLGAVVRQIGALTLGIAEDHILDHNQNSLLNAHLRLLDRLLGTAGGDDRLRNLVEGTAFKALRVIFERPAAFSPESLAFALSILSAFVHHEPTSLTFLQEQGVPQALLASLASGHPLPAQTELLIRLPQAFSALCLNPTGVEQFIRCSPVRKLLLVFLQPDLYLRPLKSHMAAHELGRGLDEFMRHQPAFRDETIRSLLEVLDGMLPLLQQSTSLYQLEEKAEGEENEPSATKSPGLTMLDLFCQALEGILQSPAHATAFLKAGGLESLFRLYSAPGLPYDYPKRSEAHSIAHLFRMLAEQDVAPVGDAPAQESVLSVAWRHVFACSPALTELFLAYHEAPRKESFFLDPSRSLAEKNRVFAALSSLQAILGLLSELYLQHAFDLAASRQAAQVIPGLATAEGEAAMLFLALLLGACVTEKESLPSPSPSADMVQSVVGSLPSLVVALFGGVARMLALHSAQLRRQAALSPESLQQVASLLANCLASQLRTRARQPALQPVLGLLGLASALFFDESPSSVTARVTLQILPMSTFGHIGGLDDLAACIQAALISSGTDQKDEEKQFVLQAYLALLGRALLPAAYRANTSWEELEHVGFPLGHQAWIVAAGQACSIIWMDTTLVLSHQSLRILLSLTSALLLLAEQQESEEPLAKAFAAARKFSAEAFSWLTADSVTLNLLASRTLACPQVVYDACVLLTHLLKGPEDWSRWFEVGAAAFTPSLLHRHLAILLTGPARQHIIEAIITPGKLILSAFLDSPESLLLAGELVALHHAGAIQLDPVPYDSALLPALQSTNVEMLHAGLHLSAALSKSTASRPDGEVPSLTQGLVRASLAALPSLDIRHRAMLPLAIISLRHLIEAQCISLLMPLELAARFRAGTGTRDRKLGPETLFPSSAPGSKAPLLGEVLALRSPEAFFSAFKDAVKMEPDGLFALSLPDRQRLAEELAKESKAMATANAILQALFDLFSESPRLPVFASPAESMAAESDAHITAGHFQRVAVLAILSELGGSLPPFHSALLAHPGFPALLHQLFDQVVPCGDLATGAINASDPGSATGSQSSVLFVSGPVWVDHFLGQVCSATGDPQALQAAAQPIVSALAGLFAQLAQQMPDMLNSYQQMSRIWCLSMTVYSLLSMRSQQLSGMRTEVVQLGVAKAMLEAKLMSHMARLLARLPAEAPGRAMVGAKLVLILETLAKHAKALLPKPVKPVPKESVPSTQGEEESEHSSTEGEGLELDSMDEMDLDDDGSSDEEGAMEEEEPFGYAHSEEDDSDSDESDDDMDIDLIDEGSASDGLGTDLSSMDDESSFGSTTSGSDQDDEEDAESVHIILGQPGEEGEYAYGDEGFLTGDDVDSENDEEITEVADEDEMEGAGNMMFDGAEDDAMEEYDSDEDDEGDYGNDLLAADSGTEPEDDANLAAPLRESDFSGLFNRRRGIHVRRNNGMSDAFLDSIFGSTEGSSFNSLVGRGAASSDLFSHPLLGRDADAPAAGSMRAVDPAIFASNCSAGRPATALAAPFKAKVSTGAPFDANREMLHSPQTVGTFRRWGQSARLFYGLPQEASALVLPALQPLIAQMQDSLKNTMPSVEQQQEVVPVQKPETIPQVQPEVLPTQTPVPEFVAPEPQDFTDNGPDAEFLLALPFDMRAEVIQQYFSDDRRPAIATALGAASIPVRLSIDPAFLARLPADLRADYERMSSRDVERYNRRALIAARRRTADAAETPALDALDALDFEGMIDEEGDGIGGEEEFIGEPDQVFEQLTRSFNAIGNGGSPDFTAMIQRLQQGLRAFAAPDQHHRIEIRVHDPAGAPVAGNAGLLAPGAEQQSQLRPVSPLASTSLAVDRSTLAGLLQAYYAPSMADKKTHYRLLASLAALPLESGLSTSTTGGVREALLGLLIRVLEAMPGDEAELADVLSGNAALKLKHTRLSRASTDDLSVQPPSSVLTVVILQRTLQLLHYLVGHDEPSKAFFTRPAASPWTVRKRPAGASQAVEYVVRYPLALLLACLEKGPILQVGMLVEFLLSLLATVSAPLKPSSSKKKKPVEADTIPLPFLHALVKALGAAELTPKAFSHASALVAHLASIEGVPAALLAGLSEASLRVADHAAKDMARLQKALEEHQVRMSETTESVQSAAAKADPALAEALRALSSPTSAQMRLLRLLKMALVLLEGNNSDLDLAPLKADLEKPQWTSLLAMLPALLTAIEARQLLHVAMGLLPVIETLFLHQRLRSRASAEQSDDELVAFAEAHRKLLNSMIRSQPALLTAPGGSFHALGQSPRVLDFDNKRALFRSQLAALKKAAAAGNTLNVSVRRAYIFEDSYHQLTGRTGDELRAAKLNIRFHGEEGVDAGGVTREWYAELCKKMFNPDNGLFLPSAIDSVAMQPNRMSWVNPDHLHFFAFVGRIIAKAIVDGRLLDCHFTRSFYKHMLGLPVTLADLEAIDPEFYKSLQWILQNDITGVLDDHLTFATETDEFGVVKTVELKPGGASIPVSEANKAEYVRLVCEYRLTTAIRPQIDAVLTGLHALIPPAILAIFTETELELLISGLPDIDLDDWRANTDYRSYTIASPQVQWFWRAVRSFDPEERAKLVQFVTGTSKVPLEGWAHLQGASGRQRFTITKDFGPTHRLPSAHTCFNQLDLPAYESYEEERAQLLKAITEGATGFGLI